ncbi:hypothetical protein PR048_003855 [Dryococelus australis]|uniref:Uncharacterized protein n=1 Tax=Dryococelus australis TaxID=614101 RepID=A0ABQ9IQC8_9NEOP|nr:hypothetical protein PR048_003855 [Dryococelus australis]
MGVVCEQETDTLFQAASRLMEGGQAPAALVKFLEVLRLLDEALVPPFRDYYLCQQSVRCCMLTFGNISRQTYHLAPTSYRTYHHQYA